jgi:hypothetical protein
MGSPSLSHEIRVAALAALIGSVTKEAEEILESIEKNVKDRVRISAYTLLAEGKSLLK